MRKYIPLVLLIFSWPILSAYIHGRAVRVLDGDIIEVMDSRKVVRIRLINIDVSEKKQDYGRWSTGTVRSLVVGKTVAVAHFRRDRYGRILGQVYTPDGMNINQLMVRVGAAWVYEQYNTDPRHNFQVADFKKLQYPLQNNLCLSIEEARCRRQKMQ